MRSVVASVVKSVVAACASAGAAVAWIPLRAGHSDAIVALAMVLVITATGACRSRSAVLAAAASAAVTFTFFDTQPYERFTIAKQTDVATAASLVVVGLLTAELALRMVRARRTETAASTLLERVQGAASLVAQGEELLVLIGAVAGQLVAVVGAEACSFSAERLDPGIPVVDRSGHLVPPPDPRTAQVALPVWALGEVVGHFVLESRRPSTLPAERLLVGLTLADQVGAALAAQAPLPPLPPGPAQPAGDRCAMVPRLRVLGPAAAGSAGADGTVVLDRLEELPAWVQDGELPSVRSHDAVCDQLRPWRDARDLAPAEEGQRDGAAAVHEQALERRYARPRLDVDGADPAGHPNALTVPHGADGGGAADGLEVGLPPLRAGLRGHRRAS